MSANSDNVAAASAGPQPLPSTRSQPTSTALASIEEATTQGAFITRVAGLLSMQFQFALSASDDLHVYQDGAYVAIDEGWLRDAILDRLPGRSRHRYSIKARMEIVEQVKSHKPRLWDRGCPPGEMAVENGVLDFSTGNLRPHSPGWLSRLKLPVEYQPGPGTTCPAWDRFLREVFPPDAIDLAWEIIGSCMTTDQLVQEAIWLKGEGGNGKSTLMKAIEGLVGKDNTCSIPIKELATDRFATSSLQDKLLLMDHDTPVDTLRDVTVFKKIVAHDEIRAQAKWGHAFSFFPFAKILMASNTNPTAQDTTYGFLRRLVVVPFDGVMVDGGTRQRQQADIIAEMTTPGELSGALNRALLGWQRVRRQGGFTLPLSVREEIEEFRVDADPIRRFVEMRMVVVGGAPGDPKTSFLSAEEVEEEYAVWAKEHRVGGSGGRKSRGAITQWVKMNLRGAGVVAGRGTAGGGGVEGRVRRGYWGLKWR